jgi:hypothetical protein
MADSITNDVTLKAACLELDAEVDRLVDAGDFTDDPLKHHKAAWSQVKRDLLRRRPAVEETDLGDTDELLFATHLCALYILYSLSEIEDDAKKTQSYWQRYRKEMREVQLTISGTEQAAGASETLLVRA